MEHLTKNQIIELLDITITDGPIKDHLKNCDSCFTSYAAIKADYLEIQHANLEKTPHKIIKKLEKEFELSENMNKSILERFLSYLDNLFLSSNSFVFNPQVIGVAGTFILLFGLYMFLPSAGSNVQTPNPIIHYDFRNTFTLRALDATVTPFGLSEDKDLIPKLDELIIEEVMNFNFEGMDSTQIISIARKNNYMLSLGYGEQFAQSPSKGDPFDSEKDTLKIIIKK